MPAAADDDDVVLRSSARASRHARGHPRWPAARLPQEAQDRIPHAASRNASSIALVANTKDRARRIAAAMQLRLDGRRRYVGCERPKRRGAAADGEVRGLDVVGREAL